MLNPLQAIPDPTVFLRYGTVGALLFIVVLLMIVGGYAVVKVATAFIAKLGNGNGTPKPHLDGTALQQSQQLREAQRQLDELKAGNKPVQFWLDAYDASGVRAVTPLLKNQEAMMVLLREVIESQRRIRVRLKMDDDE